MTFTDEQSFRLHVKNEPCARVYFLYGAESYLKKQYAERLMQKAVPDDPTGFNRMRLDGKGCDIDTIADAALALPLFAAYKCVWVSDFNPEALTETDFSKLEQLFGELPDTTVLVFTTLTQETAGKKSLPAKWNRFIKLADKAGVVTELAPRGENDLVHYARAYAEKQGSAMENAAAREVCERSGWKMDRLIQELNKLCAYRPKAEITLQDVDLLCERQLEAMVYDLSKAIAEGSFERAMALIDVYRYNREEPVAVLAALSSATLDFYRIKTGRLAGRPAKDVFKDFGYKGNPNRFYYVEKDAERLSLRYLSGALDILLQCDYDMKSSRVDSFTLLEEAVARLFSLRANEGKA